jgi:hypothetical protein
MKNLTPQQIAEKFGGRHSSGGTLRDELAHFSKGDPLRYDSFMKKTRYEMWVIGLGGMNG